MVGVGCNSVSISLTDISSYPLHQAGQHEVGHEVDLIQTLLHPIVVVDQLLRREQKSVLAPTHLYEVRRQGRYLGGPRCQLQLNVEVLGRGESRAHRQLSLLGVAPYLGADVVDYLGVRPPCDVQHAIDTWLHCEALLSAHVECAFCVACIIMHHLHTVV